MFHLVSKLIDRVDFFKTSKRRHENDASWIQQKVEQHDIVFDISEKMVVELDEDMEQEVHEVQVEVEEVLEKRETRAPAWLTENTDYEDNKEAFFDDPMAFLEAMCGPEEGLDDPDWMPPNDGMDEKVYRNLRPFIILIERYRIPSRQAAMLWNAAQLCNGNTKKSNLITHKTVLSLQKRYGKELLEKRKVKQRPYLAIESDGKECYEPYGNNKKAKPNFVTTVGLPIATDDDPEPEVEFASHFKSSEKGIAIAAGVSDTIDDSGSKDALLVTKSDGSANNTSPDVGSHRVC